MSGDDLGKQVEVIGDTVIWLHLDTLHAMKGLAVVDEKKGTEGWFAKIKPRLWLIPLWFVAQFLYEIPGAWSADHSSLPDVALRALSQQTSINSLWVSLVVILAVIFYKTPTPEKK